MESDFEITVSVSEWEYIPVLRPDLAVGQSVFAAGDIGGEYRHMVALENACAELAKLDNDWFYWLGDLNDRGPASIQCVRHVLDKRSPFKNVVEVQSNHGIMLWTAIEGGKAAVWMNDIWRHNGGKTTLQELGIDTANMEFIHLNGAERVDWLSKKLREHFSGEDLQMLRGNPSHARHGNLLFVHAGINPNMRLEETFGHEAQVWWGPYGMGTEPEDWHWAWIRFLFLGHEGEWPGGVDVVVHGHTDFGPRGFVNGNRIALDANKARPTMRMAAQIQNGRMRLITAQGESEKAPL
jgi:serine/threonine protein phosphatase 1